MTGPRKYTKTKTVSFYTLTYMEGRKRHYIDEGAIDWAALFESWKDRPRSDFTLEGIEYEPRVQDGNAVLIMHKPLSSDFLTKGGETGPRVDAEPADEEALRRFAKATAVVFIGNGDIIGVGKGGDASSPGLTYLRQFLDEYVPMHGSASWRTDPFLAESDLRRLKTEAEAVRQFSFKYHTQKDLFDAEAATSTSFNSSMHRLADSVETDIVVSIDVALPPSASRQQRQNMRNFIRAEAADLVRHSAAKPPAVTAEIDGVEEELFLTKHRLTRTAEITKESAISGSFNALVNEVIRVSVEVDEDLFE
ncbi:hypothetical protein [Kocuria sp. CPCC 205297]|uniref:hypothetical protein n=1 Tax=Kocuria sp. CPCC 205297 TaxID=3073558 RepID=UPI0034D65D05